jgi:predicted TIM-barrel fold metal-dependent hydrolase
MNKIVDCHGHIFPPLAGASGFESAALHLMYQQRALHLHSNQPIRRLRDHAVIAEPFLWNVNDPSEKGQINDIGFKVGQYGRFEWENSGERYYLQFLPPYMQDMSSLPEFMITEMDYAGINTVVLQNDHIYGNLSSYFADAIARYPDRFIGLAQVDEAFAYRDDQVALVEDQIKRQGMKGLYFTLAGFFRNGYQTYYTDPEFAPLWQLIEKLDVPVFWVFVNKSPRGEFSSQFRAFCDWYEKYPKIRSVLVHGLPTHAFSNDADVVQFPDYVVKLFTEFPVYSEVLYPIMWGGKMDYPLPRAQSHFRQLYDRFGADRLIWGSDMPNVARYCTYRQTLTYIYDYSDFLSEAERRKIFHDTTLSFFRPTSQTATRAAMQTS